MQSPKHWTPLRAPSAMRKASACHQSIARSRTLARAPLNNTRPRNAPPRSARLRRLVPRNDSSFVIFALKRIIQYLVDSWVQGIVRMAVIADINRDRSAAMNVTFVAPLPKSDLSLLSDDVTFPT